MARRLIKPSKGEEVVDVRRKKLLQKKGQSILEYLVIATVIVIAIFAIQGTVQNNMNDLYTNAAAKTANAAGALGGLAVEQ